ncbi:MAG: hypothetical protein HFG18_01020 [Oscillospiraceae bacterium]|nr:hypothetical protein [Oscillospiraceae bacterium]MCI9669890.1 hypothetical protein [Oscillospiraceae bacterium]
MPAGPPAAVPAAAPAPVAAPVPAPAAGAFGGRLPGRGRCGSNVGGGVINALCGESRIDTAIQRLLQSI